MTQRRLTNRSLLHTRFLGTTGGNLYCTPCKQIVNGIFLKRNVHHWALLLFMYNQTTCHAAYPSASQPLEHNPDTSSHLCLQT
jgi:hypothetical protein